MRSVPVGEFRARCSAILEGVRATREPIVITKRGRPVAKLVPVEAPADVLIGRLKGIIEIVGDIESPIERPKAWKAAP
jgi:prevent-host-death family protein